MMGAAEFAWLSLLLVATFCFAAHAQTQSDQCGSIGNSNENERTAQTNSMFYLNTDNPAPCTGNITSFRVCYYGPSSVDQNQMIIFMSTFAIYRRMGSGGDERYERVSDTFKAVLSNNNMTDFDTDKIDGVIQGGFTCLNDVNDLNIPLPVETGDMVGACIFDPEDNENVTRQQLNIVGTMPSEFLLGTDNTDCTVDDIPSIFLANQFSRSNSKRLHIYANIEVTTDPTTVTPTTAPPTTEQVVESTSTQEGPGLVQSGSNGLSPGSIAGLVIGLLILLALCAAIVVVILYVLMLKKRGGKYYSTTKSEKAHGINNFMYGQSQLLSAVDARSNFEASMYEVPVSTMQSRVTTHDNELSYSTYAVPDLYEYATMPGQNKETEQSKELEDVYSPLDEATFSYAQLLEKSKQEDIYGNLVVFLQPASEEDELYAQMKACGIRNIPADHINVEDYLGAGQFSTVKKGSWKNGTKSIPVALKILKQESSEMDKTKFLQEAAIMAQFRHPNVVTLYGVVSKSEPLMLVVELIQKGDLRNHLHTLRPDPGQLPVTSLPNLLLSFSQQVALGMHYLSAKGFVHRDLAARNILVSKENICKVADFGMSRDLADENYYVSHGGKIPVKWTAPEAINFKKYSTASDVWSYGCLLYEIWSLGHKPFEGVTNTKAIEMIDSGNRLAPPPGCPKIIYELMTSCWNPHPVRRPSFREHLLILLSKQEEVLSIPQEDLDTHNLAGVLGSQLEFGEDMYQELQNKYAGNNDDYQEVD